MATVQRAGCWRFENSTLKVKKAVWQELLQLLLCLGCTPTRHWASLVQNSMQMCHST